MRAPGRGFARRGAAGAGVFLALSSAALAPRVASAHAQSFSYITVAEDRGRVEVGITVHRDDAAPAIGIAPESLFAVLGRPATSRQLAALGANGVRIRSLGRSVPLRFAGLARKERERSVELHYDAVLAAAPTLTLTSDLFVAIPNHETFVNVYRRGRLIRQDVLTQEHRSLDIGMQGLLPVFATFVGVGIRHIFIGPDHILFIVGLLLLGGSLGRVLKVATAFTVAHSITLAAAALGWILLPARWTEPAIALSIVAVGIENLRTRPNAPDWRTRVAFGFGLVHGFGFASVLREVGLPREALGVSLVAFNLGVEAGQACIVLLATPLLAAFRDRPRAAHRVVAVGSWAIILAGSYWFVQRVSGKV